MTDKPVERVVDVGSVWRWRHGELPTVRYRVLETGESAPGFPTVRIQRIKPEEEDRREWVNRDWLLNNLEEADD